MMSRAWFARFPVGSGLLWTEAENRDCDMSSRQGRSVRLFLADGTTSGLTIAEIVNWTGHVIAGPRSGLPILLKRPELDRTGVYLLMGHDPEDPDTAQIYIGESDNVRKRLVLHANDANKDFWERTCVVISKDQNITKAHARYLESRLISIANSDGTAKVVNVANPQRIELPEADVSDMEFFIDQLQLILPVLGFDLRRQPGAEAKTAAQSVEASADNLSSPLFRLTSKKYGIEATAREIDGEFVVLEGSGAVKNWDGKQGLVYQKRQRHLVESGKLVPQDDGHLRFRENMRFRSSSGAASTILGVAISGMVAWQVEGTNLNYGEWQKDRVSRAMAKTSRDQGDDKVP